MRYLTFIFLSVCTTPLFSQTNTSYGTNAGNSGTDNSAFGYSAGTVVTGSANSFFGAFSGSSTTSAASNTFIGYGTGFNNTTGASNTFIGRSAGFDNTSASYNVFVGVNAGRFTTTGSYNMGMGYQALTYNVTGQDNIGIGYRSLYLNTANNNVAVGNISLTDNTSGAANTAIGQAALPRNTTGTQNTAVGESANFYNTSGSFNDAFGANSGVNTTSLSNTVALGSYRQTTANNQVRIGSPSMTSIGGQVSWSTLSDGRFKVDIKEDVPGLEFITRLRPVSYFVDRDALYSFLNMPGEWKQRQSTRSVRQTGFVAQEVEAIVKNGEYVFNGVETPQNDKDYYGIRYAEFVVPLVKAIQELVVKNEQQQKQIDLLLNELNKTGMLTTPDHGKMQLFQNSPNPFLANTEIGMLLPEHIQSASLIIYDMQGNQRRSIEVKERGNIRVLVSGDGFKPGMYMYSLIADGKIVDTKRFILKK